MTPEIKLAILERMAQGESVRSICNDPSMPSYSSVTSLRIKDPEFAERFAQARLDGVEAFAEDCIWIADNEPDPNKAKVRIDIRKWHAAKLMPKTYGERLEVQVQDSRSTEELEEKARRLGVQLGLRSKLIEG